MKKLIIAANLGNLRILKYNQAGDDPIEQDHLAEKPGESGKQHVKSMRDTVTDQAGRFTHSGPVGQPSGMSYGEEHNLKAELERSALKKMIERIECALSAEGHPPWILAAPQPILAQMKQSISRDAAKCLLSTVGADLTRMPLPELEKRFL